LVAGLVADLVSRIHEIRRPDLVRQVAILEFLAGEDLEGKEQMSNKWPTQPQVEKRKLKVQLTRSGGAARS
jgi:hypothetical protein